MSKEGFDYIIVGAGTAGCLLANRLSADPHKRVLLLEAGGKDDYHWVHIPVGYLHCIGNPRTDWCFQTEAEAGLNGRRLRYPRGKVLGGSSSINGMIYMRGQSRDYEHWADLTGDDTWRWDRVLRAFRRHEHHWRLDDPKTAPEGFADMHGHKGEWRVEQQRLRWPVLDAFAQAAQQAGIPATSDFNAGTNEGVGYFEVNQRKGLRWNTAKAFLRPTCLGRPNFELWTGAQVRKLRLLQDDTGLRCSGVEVLTPHGVEQPWLNAGGEVILAAGAVGSPQLLQLSGLGPGALLQRLGLSVKADLPGVGANLQDHLQLRTVYKVRGTQTLNTRSASMLGKALIGLEYALRRSGPMSMAPSQLGAFTRSSPDKAWPDLEYHVQPLSLDAFGEPLHGFDAFTASVCHLNPGSRGHVHITSPDATVAPAIRPNYLSTEGDRRIAAESLRLTRRIVAQPALAAFRPEEHRPGPQAQSDEELIRAAGEIGTTIFHPVGTCKMGRREDPLAVVDSRLRVRGVSGLRVADASVMPTITSGNTASPTLMIAEKLAGWLVG
ncbi:GMC family oxidoreductase N-terminal domain-containing protein [Pelomonas sp. UHG3]|uniref:GMC family oxidoreductase N-terminal domain-containing protein n=1 Tax=Roseateles hydrophilus TaxID=2975054 RepID=A0ACC6CCY9_9BURK|nr:GMC family oxidoreductase N-terminal domain-containing protein [Pelomonas sp. UHG3]MCY4746204.1 GMC family oxidoreductase N-terminal domain-containing protein [Pelomonas sp. UHG3]